MQRSLAEIAASIRHVAAFDGLVRLHSAPRDSRTRGSDRAFANQLLAGLGLRCLPEGGWLSLSPEAATDFATRLMHQDLAYASELLDARRASRLALELCGALDRYASAYFASGHIEPGFKKWAPLGLATFEIALVGMDDRNAFLLLATAED